MKSVDRFDTVWDDVKTLRHERRLPKPTQRGSTPPSHANFIDFFGEGGEQRRSTGLENQGCSEMGKGSIPSSSAKEI